MERGSNGLILRFLRRKDLIDNYVRLSIGSYGQKFLLAEVRNEKRFLQAGVHKSRGSYRQKFVTDKGSCSEEKFLLTDIRYEQKFLYKQRFLRKIKVDQKSRIVSNISKNN